MPGASILDRETTEAAGEFFGKDPAWTVGTGSFILQEWEAGKGMKLTANRDCWTGAPKCDGLDLRFLTGTGDPEKGRIIVSYMINMVRSLGINLIAEGVEKIEQARFLQGLGSTEMQGYYFYKPMSVRDFEKLMKSKTEGM